MKKTEFRWFSIADYDKEAEYLSRRHAEGWRFVKVSLPGIYTFVSCEPEEVVYQLDYNQEGIEHKEEYVQMFRDCGWEYLFDFVGFSYFRKRASEMNGEETIFCDNASRLDMMKRVLKGRLIPLLILFCAVVLPQTWAQLYYYRTDGRVFNYGLFISYMLISILYLAIFAAFGIAYYRLKKKVS